MKFIAKPNTWFKAGTECKLIVEYGSGSSRSGIFLGIRITENPASEGGYEVGEEREDEEGCTFDEFDIVE